MSTIRQMQSSLYGFVQAAPSMADHLVVDLSVALVELCISASSKVACKADLNSSCVTSLSLYLAPVHFC